MAYYYIAETNLSYLLRAKESKALLWSLRGLIMATTFYGSIKTAEMAWTVGDIGVGLMAWLNIIAIILLRKPALDALKDYHQQKKEGKDPVYIAAKLGVKNTEEWEGPDSPKHRA
jgi:AGCS family alanine or glycine:cation symporter